MTIRSITTRQARKGAALLYMFFLSLFLGVSALSF